jgi:hypothetical protein
MKKIITLMGAVLLVASSFAQYHSENKKRYDDDKQRDVAYNDSRYHKDNDRRNDRYTSAYRERDMQIAQINREYNRKIERVEDKWMMSRSKKEAVICSLEDKRRYEIRKVYEKFNRRNGHFNDNNSKNRW